MATGLEVRNTSDIGISGISENNAGVQGISKSSVGVSGESDAPPPNRYQPGTSGIYGTATNNPGVWGVSQKDVGVLGLSATQPGVFGFSGSHAGVFGRSDVGVGLYGVSDRSYAGLFPRAGVFGYSSSFSHAGVYGRSDGYGTGVYGASDLGYAGYFQGHGYFQGDVEFGGLIVSRSSKGMDISGETSFSDNVIVGGELSVYGDLMVSGALHVFGSPKSAVVRFPDRSHRRLYSLESPESWFEDFGRARLSRGRARVKLDRAFASVVRTGDYHIFLSAEGESRGLYVSRRRRDGFEVREQQRGTSTLQFSYRVVARRKDAVAPRFKRVVRPRFTSLRFAAAKGITLPTPPALPKRPQDLKRKFATRGGPSRRLGRSRRRGTSR